MKRRICAIGGALLAFVILLQAPAARSQKTYQTPDGSRFACADKGPLDRYQKAQDEEIDKLIRQKSELDKPRKAAEEKIKKDQKNLTDAATKIKQLDTQITNTESELKQAQGSEKRRLEDKLDDLKAEKIEQQAAVRKASNDLSADQKELNDLKARISDIDAQLAKYNDRKKKAQTSYSHACVGCDPGSSVNASTGKCQCDENDPYWKMLCPPGQTCAGLNCGR